MGKTSPGRLKVQNGREGGYRETNTHTHGTQTQRHTHTHPHKGTLLPGAPSPHPTLEPPTRVHHAPTHKPWHSHACFPHTRPAPCTCPRAHPPAQPHTLLFLPAAKELDSFCLEMTHWASRERLHLGTDPEGWRTRPRGWADVPACGAACSCVCPGCRARVRGYMGVWLEGMSAGGGRACVNDTCCRAPTSST